MCLRLPRVPNSISKKSSLVPNPDVLFLKGLDRSGTSFFVTDTGLIATNAHVAGGEGVLLAKMPSGTELEARVVFLDADLGITLLKVEG